MPEEGVAVSDGQLPDGLAAEASHNHAGRRCSIWIVFGDRFAFCWTARSDATASATVRRAPSGFDRLVDLALHSVPERR
jgi:hypothetical protein